MTTGRFITFEGGEGAGKSTQIARLSARLDEAGITNITTREPGGSSLGERVRELLLDPAATERSALTETLLFSAARVDHIEAVITPALTEGTWVLSDRFVDSTRAYQGAADGVPQGVLQTLEGLVLQGCMPDLTVLLDLPAEDGLRRAEMRAVADADAGIEGGHASGGVGQDHFELRDLAFHKRLRQGFLDIAAAEPERCVLLDALQDVDTLAQDVWRAVSDRFGVA